MIFLNNVYINNIRYNITNTENNNHSDVTVYCDDFVYTGFTDNQQTHTISHNTSCYSVLKSFQLLKKIVNSNIGIIERKTFIFFGKYNPLILLKNISFLQDDAYFIIFIVVDDVYTVLKDLKKSKLPMPHVIYSVDKYPQNVVDTCTQLTNSIHKIYGIFISKYVLINFSIYLSLNSGLLNQQVHEKDKIYIADTLDSGKPEQPHSLVYINNKNVKILKYKNIFKEIVDYNFYI